MLVLRPRIDLQACGQGDWCGARSSQVQKLMPTHGNHTGAWRRCLSKEQAPPWGPQGDHRGAPRTEEERTLVSSLQGSEDLGP